MSLIKCSNLSFSYENQMVVSGLSFQVDEGDYLCIVGENGTGKTTLIRVFLGLIYPSSGTASLTDCNGVSCSISAGTRELFGYVPQGNTMFAGTIAENMRMVKSDATDDEIRSVLETACAYEFVRKLPEDIYTHIGEKGTGLSEGQAQRIAIARALLRDAPILILDEATSALDTDTEERVLKNIMSIGAHRTCIVTTHRPSVLTMSDHIYRIKENHLERVK